jgi:hypothetical protein
VVRYTISPESPRDPGTETEHSRSHPAAPDWLETIYKGIVRCAERYADQIDTLPGVTTQAELARLATDTDRQEVLFRKHQRQIEIELARYAYDLSEGRRGENPEIILPRTPDAESESPGLTDETICRLLGIYVAGRWTIELGGQLDPPAIEARFS